MAKEHELLFVISVLEIVNNFQDILEEHINRRIALWILCQHFSRPTLVPMDHRKQLFPVVLKRVGKKGGGTSRSTVQKQQDWIFIGGPSMKQIPVNPVDQDVFLNPRDFF